MKTTQIFFLSLLLTLLLSACSSDAAAQTNASAAIDEVYTAVAMTLTAEVNNATPTPTLSPSSTPTMIATSTLIPTIAPSATIPYQLVSSSSDRSCETSSFVSDVTITDGTVLAPAQSFTKTWRILNNGTCTWATSYSIAFVSGSSMNGSTTALDSSTSSGDQLDVSVDMVAPSSTGTYTGYWRLKNAAGAFFGQAIYVQIVVSTSASTLTPTPTASATASSYTDTPTPTAIESTSTPVPTSTTLPAAITIPTDTPVPTVVPTDVLDPVENSSDSSSPTTAPTEAPAS